MSILKEIYSLREDFLVIALTGRTGVGCSKVAEILTLEKSKLFELIPKKFEKTTQITNEERKYNIAYDYVHEHWIPFELIQYKRVIALLLIKYDLVSLQRELMAIDSEALSHDLFAQDNQRNIEGFLGAITTDFEKLHGRYKKDFGLKTISELKSATDLKKLYRLWVSPDFRALSDRMHDGLNKISFEFRIRFLQTVINNFRQFGSPFKKHRKQAQETYVYFIAEAINKIIKSIRDNNQESRGKVRVVIDSLRNSLEIRFFKERYSAFYTMAVNASEAAIINNVRLHYHKQEVVTRILDIDNSEYEGGDGNFYVQDVANCIQKADLHLNNSLADHEVDTNVNKYTIYRNVIRYTALILHPGIISPTPEERCMQFAYTAKYNSGCISRQVGAVITDQYFSIKGVGWNNTPEYQVPCQLRSLDDLIDNNDEAAFSVYERLDNKFREQLAKEKRPNSAQLDGRNCSFCFKDVKNRMDNQKNQVHTRSLHAEENAMLQIVKYGGTSLMGGILFSTASPCELCSKKAYQLGINKIYYIDPYPGIARAHILQGGTRNPELILFNGAIGNAYHKFYEPFMNYKEEIKLL
jgi:deoxycytidylate deaminase